MLYLDHAVGATESRDHDHSEDTIIDSTSFNLRFYFSFLRNIYEMLKFILMFKTGHLDYNSSFTTGYELILKNLVVVFNY